MTQSKLKALIEQAAERAEQDGIKAGQSEFGGPLHQWVERNCELRAGTSFWVVFLVACELADREARREGYQDQSDRAIKLAKQKRHERMVANG